MQIPEQNLPSCAFGNKPLDPTLPLAQKVKPVESSRGEYDVTNGFATSKIAELEKSLADSFRKHLSEQPGPKLEDLCKDYRKEVPGYFIGQVAAPIKEEQVFVYDGTQYCTCDLVEKIQEKT